MFDIQYAAGAANDISQLRAYDQRIIVDRIKEQLANEPLTATRAKKVVVGLKPPWEHEEPIWQLRVDEYRVFYDVDSEHHVVNVRAIRRKPPHHTTEEVL